MQIHFSYNTEYGPFSDSLWFSDDAPLPPDVEIDAMKQARLDNWLAIVSAQSGDPDVVDVVAQVIDEA